MGPRVWDRRRLLHSTFEVEGEPSWGGRAYTHTYSFNLYSFVFKPLRTWTKEDWYWLADLLVYPPSLQKKTAFDDYLLTVFSGRKETSIECLLSLSLSLRSLSSHSLSLSIYFLSGRVGHAWRNPIDLVEERQNSRERQSGPDQSFSK